MRKIFVLAALAMAMLIFGGCGDNSQENSQGETKVGMLSQLNSSPEKNVTFYDNFSSMVMSLTSHNVDKLQVYNSVANYMKAQNSEFEVHNTVNLMDEFCCAMRKDDTQLRDEFNSAIQGMKDDGTLTKLIKTYVTDMTKDPPAVEIPKIDGAETIEVGVTGDLPPLDFVSADGKPAGFNTAVLAEISKRIHKNIELVQIESSSRAVALTSGKVDVVFWVVVPADKSDRPKDFDKPQGIEVTQPYYQDSVVDINLGGALSGMNG